MVLLSPSRTQWKLIVTLALLLNLTSPALSLKCYSCTSRVDCLINGNLNKEVECANGYNACVVMKGKKDRMAKYCWMNPEKTAKAKGVEEGSVHYFCYSDLCNRGDYANGRATEERVSGGAGVLSPFITGTSLLTLSNNWNF